MGWRLYNARAYFSRLTRQWDALNSRLYGDHPLFDSDFVEPLIEHFATPATRIAVLGDVADPAGMLLVEPASAGVWSAFQPAQWQICPILIEPAELEAFGNLIRVLPASVRILNFPRRDARFGPVESSTLVPLPAECAARVPSMRIDLAAGFDRYWGSRGRRLRKNLRRTIEMVEAAGLAPALQERSDLDGVLDRTLARARS